MGVQEIEFVEVTLRVPREADDWFRREYEDVESRYQWELWDSLRAYLEALNDDEGLDVEGKKAHQVLEEALEVKPK